MFNESPIFKDFVKAVDRFKEVLSLEKTPIIRDSAIKRFEFCFDLAWKSIKSYAKLQGLECNSPREAIKIAFQLKLIDYNEKWFDLLDDRNCTVHLYKEDYADKVYERLPVYLDMFTALIRSIHE